MKKEPVYGNHIGIVVNQDDPEYRGRVQVYIPYLTNTLYSGWNETLTDKKFKNLGGDGDLTPDIVEKLKNVLPWAECAAPIFGGGTSATYNSATGRISTNPYKTVGNVQSGPAEPLANPSVEGLMKKAEDILDKDNRRFDFGNYKRDENGKTYFETLDGRITSGGRCATAVTCLVGAGQNIPGLGAKGIGPYGGAAAKDIASGRNTYFQQEAGYSNPEPVSSSYSPKLGEIMVMQGGSSGEGHILVCVKEEDGNGPAKMMSDYVSDDYQSYLPGGRNSAKYSGVSVLRPSEEGSKSWRTTMGFGSDKGLGVPISPNAATAAQVAATTVNPDNKATGGDSTVKDVSELSEGEKASPLQLSSKKTVDPQQLYNNLHDHLKTKLGNNPVPQDITRYGVEANLDGLTTLMMKVAYKESSFYTEAKYDYGKFGAYDAATRQKTIPGDSDGLYQMSPVDAATYKHLGFKGASNQEIAWYDEKQNKFYNTGANAFTVEQLRDPNFNIDLATSIWADSILDSGKVGNNTLKTYGWLSDSEVNAGKLNKYDNAGYANLKYTGPGGTLPTVSSSDSLTSPYPNFNAGNVAAHYSGPQASGMISIPKPGAKVFVFFLAGDIQKPVYFANALEPDTIRKSLQGAPYSKEYDDQNGKIHTDSFGNGPAKIALVNDQGILNGIPVDNSNISVGANGSQLKLAAGATNLNSGGDHTVTALGGSYENVNGPKTSHTGPNYAKTDGDRTIQVGSFDKQQIEAAEKLHKLVKEIQVEKVENIEAKASKGEKVPCPICSVSYPVDKSSALAKRAFNFLRKLGTVPWFTYSIDLLEFIASLVMIPFFTIMQAFKINGGSCGNPDCKNGQVPSPQKPIEEANKIAAEKIKSKQKEISNLEQQLGNGGTCSVVASKDIIISAGLILDDQPVYSKIGHMSHGCKVEPAKNAPGTIIKSSTGVPQVMYTEATQIPGGNIMLRGGNKIQLIGGAPGIEITTKGKVTIGAGSVEIISAESDLMLTSPTHTILKGNGVTIDADDKSGKGGGVVINANHTSVKGLGVTGNAQIAGGMNVKGELSCTYTNTVGERVQSGSGSSPDQKGDYANWACGTLQTNDILNTTRTALTHFAMPGALLNITNIVKLMQQLYNTLFTSTVVEPLPTGFAIGFIYSEVFNWHHNHQNEPEDHHHDYTRPRGTYYDSEAGVHQSACKADHIPTKARKKGTGPDGGPKTLAGCGGFGFGGGNQSSKRRKFKLNSFGIADQTKGFTGTRLSDNNVKFAYNKDGTIKVILPNTTGNKDC